MKKLHASNEGLKKDLAEARERLRSGGQPISYQRSDEDELEILSLKRDKEI